MPSAEPFFVSPTTLDEALSAVERPDAMLVGGATATTLLLKNRLIEPGCLVWLAPLAELSGIGELPDGTLEIGATTTLREINRSVLLRTATPALAKACGEVGNPRVRAVATIGGAIVHGDPRQDVPPVLLALRASLEAVSRRGRREIALSEFFLGFMETALDDDEIVTRVTIPPRVGWRDAYHRFTPNSEDDYPTVGVAVSLFTDDEGIVRDAEIALGGVDGSAILAPEAAAALIGSDGGEAAAAEAARRAVAACNPSDDQRGSASYKKDMVEVWTRRTVAACLA